MSSQTFSGPIRSGTVRDNSTANVGVVQLMQTTAMAKDTAGTANVDFTFYLPASSQILDILVDMTTAWDSATSALLTVGQTAGGTEYFPSTSVKTTGRAAPTLTAAMLTNMANIGTNTSVVVRIAQTGATTAGALTVTVRYAQTSTSNWS